MPSVKADAVLETLNLKRKEVIGIKIDSASIPNPVPMMRQAMGDNGNIAQKSSTPVVGGEQQVEAAVTLDIGY